MHLSSMKRLLIYFLIAFILSGTYFFYKHFSSGETSVSIKKFPATTLPSSKSSNFYPHVKTKAASIAEYAKEKGYSTQYSFLIDMSLPSGRNRFFVYDLENDSIVHAGLVSHGSCRTGFLEQPVFSNVEGCGCSSAGKYKVGNSYEGQFGKAFKLHGLDSTNSNAFKRYVVLHAYDCLPDEEIYPLPVCNSLGCPMVSYKFLDTVSGFIEKSRKPVLLWIYN